MRRRLGSERRPTLPPQCPLRGRAFLRKYYVDAMKVQVKQANGSLKQNTRAGLVHFKRKESDDDGLDDFGSKEW